MLKEFDVIGCAYLSGYEASSMPPNGKSVFAIKALASGINLRIAQDASHELIIGIGEFFSGRAGIRQVCCAADKSPAKNCKANEIRVLAEAQDRLARIDRIEALHGAVYSGLISMRESSRIILALPAPFRDLRAQLKFIRTCLAVRTAQEVR